jgi:hypothetical protein
MRRRMAAPAMQRWEGVGMAAPRMDDARSGYLVSCPACDASNPVNAIACWYCEQTLPTKDPFEPSAPLQPPTRADDDSPDLTARASFFPVLRDEASEPAANDAPTWDSEMPGAAESSTQDAATSARRRWLVGGASIAALAALVWFVAGRPDERHEPPTSGTLSKSAGTVAAPPVATRDPPPSPPAAEIRPAPEATGAAEQPPTRDAPQKTAQPTPQRADEPPARPRRLGNARPPAAADTEPAPLKPVPAPCTPNVAALGLCSPQVP